MTFLFRHGSAAGASNRTPTQYRSVQYVEEAGHWTAILAIIAPAGAAFAHDDGYDGYDYGWSHSQDHREHRQFHREERREHAQAHDYGFYSPWEHDAWHAEERGEHRNLHYEYPNTRHDHYARRRSYDGSSSGYGYGYGY